MIRAVARKLTPLTRNLRCISSIEGCSDVKRMLGFETTFDDTSAAIIECRLFQSSRRGAQWKREVIARMDLHQWDLWREAQGINPPDAARKHDANLPVAFKATLDQAGIPHEPAELKRYLSGIAVCVGPGLTMCLKQGLHFAETLSKESSLPLHHVNHLEAHILVHRLVEDVNFPFLALVVSGGHTQLVLAREFGVYDVIGNSLDDAVGEGFDKVHRMLNLPFEDRSAGATVEECAKEGNPFAFDINPMVGQANLNFSFSGLKNRVRVEVLKHNGGAGCAIDGVNIRQTVLEDPQFAPDIAASFQRAVVLHLTRQCERAFVWCNRVERIRVRRLVVVGGVAANENLRDTLQTMCKAYGVTFSAPPLSLCGDNGANVAWSALEYVLKKRTKASPSAPVDPRWPVGNIVDARLHKNVFKVARRNWKLQQARSIDFPIPKLPTE